jgi:hypothetical protein
VRLRRSEYDQVRRLRQMAAHYRQRGYEDGRAGRAAGSTQAEYQAGWKRGMEARREERGE